MFTGISQESHMTRTLAAQVAAVAALLLTQVDAGARNEHPAHDRSVTIHVAGSGMDHLDTAVVHSQEQTSTGMIQKSTEIVDLDGDLKGRVLYDVT
jgi:hypothetical protein